MTKEEALKASRNGAIAAFILALFTALVIVVALTSDSDGFISIWADPINFVDVAIVLLCSYGMHNNSRVAALFMFVYYIFSKVFMGLEAGQFFGLGFAIIFLYFFGRAIQGTFSFHKFQREDGADYRSAPLWAKILGLSAIVILLLMMTLGLLKTASILPSFKVLHQSQMPQRHLDTLKTNGIIYEEDVVQYFYSYGNFSIMEGGSIVTDNEVIIYFKDEEGDTLLYEMNFREIEEVEKIQDGGYLNNALYRVVGFDSENWLLLELSNEKRGDERFVQAISDGMRMLCVKE